MGTQKTLPAKVLPAQTYKYGYIHNTLTIITTDKTEQFKIATGFTQKENNEVQSEMLLDLTVGGCKGESCSIGRKC